MRCVKGSDILVNSVNTDQNIQEQSDPGKTIFPCISVQIRVNTKYKTAWGQKKVKKYNILSFH